MDICTGITSIEKNIDCLLSLVPTVEDKCNMLSVHLKLSALTCIKKKRYVTYV